MNIKWNQGFVFEGHAKPLFLCLSEGAALIILWYFSFLSLFSDLVWAQLGFKCHVATLNLNLQ